jgi:putative Ca2+/H+ antiporter (TMEM165/GDT1 family)
MLMAAKLIGAALIIISLVAMNQSTRGLFNTAILGFAPATLVALIAGGNASRSFDVKTSLWSHLSGPVRD